MIKRSVLITGGAGYVGAQLAPLLEESGFKVVVYDNFWFSSPDIFSGYSQISCIKGDIRDRSLFRESVKSCTDVIHLACISNDPSFDLNPSLGKEINFDCFQDIVQDCKEAGVNRFIYASSSSVYGIKTEDNVNEELELKPLTDYSKFKAQCEEILLEHTDKSFIGTILRPATVCGYSKRQRLDVVVNILTNHAVNNKKIKIFGGEQKRPNIHIKDMARAYLYVLNAPKDKIKDQIFNIGSENIKVKDIAKLVSDCTKVEDLEVEQTDDIRSYHISSKKFYKTLEFTPQHTVNDAIKDLCASFERGEFSNPLENPDYFNVKHLLENKIK